MFARVEFDFLSMARKTIGGRGVWTRLGLTLLSAGLHSCLFSPRAVGDSK